MDQSMPDAPADVLVEARRTLEALRSSGLSREVLLQMWEAGDSASEMALDDPLARGICHPHFGHRPRISVSSTSSGSSGHASIWSMGSQNSATSVATHYSTPLPPTPPSSASQTSQSAPQLPPPAQQQQPQPVGASLSQVAGAETGWGPGRFKFYWCTSCETRFKRKYDWKRHEEEFHERWKKYPCPEPGCNRSFWGANTFNQHHKASHGCKSCPHSEKVVKYLKRRKYWACGFCSALHPSRERHVEHVARHFESGKTKADWMHSRVVYGLLHQPLIHEAWKDKLMSKAAEFAGRQPNFSWDPNQTGRAQGFMENESPGQLQDLLEFFSGSTIEAESIVAVAYELADLVFLSVPASPPMQYAQCFPQPQQQQQQQPSQLPSPSHPQQQQRQQQQQPQPTPQPTGVPPPAYPAQHAQPPLLSPPAIPSQSLSPQLSPQQQQHHQHEQQQHHHQQQIKQEYPQHPPQMHVLPSQQHLAAPSHPPPPPPYTEVHNSSPLMPPPLFHSNVVPRHHSEPLRRASLERDLPPPPAEAPPMHFQYMTNNMVFEDWESFASTVVDENAPAPTPVSAEWPMMTVPYFSTAAGH